MKPGQWVKWIQGSGNLEGCVVAVIPSGESLFVVAKAEYPEHPPKPHHSEFCRWDRLLVHVSHKPHPWYSVRIQNVVPIEKKERFHKDEFVPEKPVSVFDWKPIPMFTTRGLGRPLAPINQKKT